MAILDVDEWSILHWIIYVARCERCGSMNRNVALHTAATAYDDPKANSPLMLCAACAEDYYHYWGEMWAEYEASRR